MTKHIPITVYEQISDFPIVMFNELVGLKETYYLSEINGTNYAVYVINNGGEA